MRPTRRAAHGPPSAGLWAGGPAGSRCPICREPVTRSARPFCSARCADIDLGRWLSGSYAVPAEDDDPDGGSSPSRAGHGQGD